MTRANQFLWVEKYRPTKIEDTILPERIKKQFRSFVEQHDCPNMILSGRPGIGKTTVARALLDEFGSDYIVVNGSLNAGIDVLRNEIADFASSVSFSGGRKFVILDEADYLNQNTVQPALRSFMEQYSKNCGFIFTCNYRNRIIPALSESRCAVIEFDIKSDEKPKLAMAFMKRLMWILGQENVEFEKPVIAEFINKYFPDWRRILNEIQVYSSNGKIDSGLLVNFEDIELKTVFELIKAKDYTALRKWVSDNKEIDQGSFFSKLYKELDTILTPASLAQSVMLLGKYQYQAPFAADKEINIAACLTEIMCNAEFE